MLFGVVIVVVMGLVVWCLGEDDVDRDDTDDDDLVDVDIDEDVFGFDRNDDPLDAGGNCFLITRLRRL